MTARRLDCLRMRAVGPVRADAADHRVTLGNRAFLGRVWFNLGYQGKEVVHTMHDQHGTLEVRGR